MSGLTPRRAAAELVVIVAGVLIALAFDGLWQARADREAEIEWLVALREETADNLRAVRSDANARRYARREEGLRALAAAVRGGALPDSVRLFVTQVMAVGRGPYVRLERSAWESFLANDGPRFLRDPEVSRKITRLYSRLSIAKEDSGLSQRVLRLVPGEWVGQRGGLVFLATDGIHADSVDATLRIAARRIVADPVIAEEVNAEFAALASERAAKVRWEELLEPALAMLDSVLAARGVPQPPLDAAEAPDPRSGASRP